MNANKNAAKKTPNFICENCDFICIKLCDWNRHICTLKHKMLTEANEKKAEKTPKYVCKLCNFTTNKLSNMTTHLNSKKHKRISSQNIIVNDEQIDFFSCKCGKTYTHKSSLSKHKKLCLYEENTNANTNTNANDSVNDSINDKPILTSGTPIDNTLILQLVKQNQDFKDLILQQNKQIIELSKEKSITNNNTNYNIQNKFNMNFFLNEQCKNALNIKDFVSTLQLQLSDLERTGDLGFVEGISKIFIKGLKELDVYKRPLHCSDLKRETLYIKDSDKWEKDSLEKDKLKGAIKEIASKNMKQLPEWIDKNPSCYDASSKSNDTYLNIIGNSMSGANKTESENNYQKIIHNIAKEVIIEKE